MKKIGRGIGCMWYGCGSTGVANPSSVFMEVLEDSTVNLLIGCADIGQGSTTVMAQIAAEELGMPYENIQVIAADTMVTPDSGISSASRQTVISGNAVMDAARNAKKKLAPVAAEVLKVPEKSLVFKGGDIYSKAESSRHITFSQLMLEMKKRGIMVSVSGNYNPDTYFDSTTYKGVPYESYSYATVLVELEVDTATGIITLLKVVSAHDVGKAINRDMAEGQIEGGVAMGQGYALLEKCECSDGIILNPTFSKYLIATAMDTPEIYPILVEIPDQIGPFGAKALGEPALIPVIPAIIDAVEDAIGIRFNDLPITPTDVLRELAKQSTQPISS